MWDLSAPASQVLLTGVATPTTWTIKLALKELVLRRSLELLRVEQRRFLRAAKVTDVLRIQRWPEREVGRSLIGVMEAFPKSSQSMVDGIGAPIEVVAQEVMRWYRAGGGYIQAEVVPELEQRGFYRRVEDRQVPSWQLTEAGEAKLVELRRLMDQGNLQFPVWVHQERERAITYIQEGGPMLLLLGNPAPWLWVALAAVLDGDELGEEAIPWDAEAPFPVPDEVRRTSGQASEGAWVDSREDDGNPNDESSSTGGGGGGFDGPGEQIDGAIDDASDGGDGDGE